MCRPRAVLVLFLVSLVSAGKHDIYQGHSVHGVKLRDNPDRSFIYELQQELDLDFWQDGYPGSRDVLVMLTPNNRNMVLELLDEKDITHYLHVANVAKNLEEHDDLMIKWRQDKSRSGRLQPFEDFPRLAEIYEYLERIAAEYPDITTLVTAGQSSEGRDVKYLKISTTNFTNSSKPVYYMEAMIHAREWITTPVTLYSIHRLVEDLHEEDRELLESIDWIILPVVNPDGYEYTHTDMRLWRRTRSRNPNVNDTCIGVDGNRNFDMNFNTVGVSSDPCSDIYPGHEAFSEPETRIVRDIIHENLDRMELFLDIHSYGNWILFPYGDEVLPDNFVRLYHISAAMGAAIDAVKLPEAPYYQVGNAGSLLYPTSGSADDYAQHVGVPFAICLELPGYGYEFQVPPQYISAVNKETWRGIAASARLARIHHDARTT